MPPHRLFPPPCPDKNIRHIIHHYIRNAVLDKSGKIKYMIEMISYAVAAHHGLFDCVDIEHTDIFSKKLSQVDDYEEATDEFCSI